MGHFESEAYSMLWFFEIFSLVCAMLVIGTLAGDYPSQWDASCIVLALIGFLLFSIAKLSMFRQGQWLTFGSSRMTPINRRFYRTGYFFVGCSMVMALALALVNHWIENVDYWALGAVTVFGLAMIVYTIWAAFIQKHKRTASSTQN